MLIVITAIQQINGLDTRTRMKLLGEKNTIGSHEEMETP